MTRNAACRKDCRTGTLTGRCSSLGAYGKHKEMSRAWILLELVGDEAVEAVEAFAHIDRFERHKDAGGGPCGNHRGEVFETSAKRVATSWGEKPCGISKTTPALSWSR